MAKSKKKSDIGEGPKPLTIPRAEHPISQKDIDLEALKVLYRLRDAGHTAYLVGGGVRDLFLGKVPKDFDISTDARPGQLRKLFRNSRIIGKRFRLVQVFFRGDKIIEVSTFRKPSEYDLADQDEVLPSNNTFGTPADDAFRRDLTINALFYEIENFSVIDYTGGVRDLKDGVVRIIGDPGRRITRDPVRMMRAVRHAARSNFKIEENTWEAIKKHRDKLSLCPVSRVRDELLRDLQGGASREWARLCVKSGLMTILFPFYKGLSHAAMDKLYSLLGVVDRLHREGQQVPEYIVMALVCLPWADEKMGLSDKVRKGKESHKFSQKLRATLTDNLQHLTIKRAVKEQVVGLLVTLPIFAHHGAKDKWPSWLTRKSYFADGQKFCALYREAMGEAEPVKLVFEVKSPAVRKTPRKSSAKRRNRSPSFSPKNKGGIFGFKK